MSDARCACGHAKRTHIDGRALCLARSCPLCLVYVPDRSNEHVGLSREDEDG